MSFRSVSDSQDAEIAEEPMEFKTPEPPVRMTLAAYADQDLKQLRQVQNEYIRQRVEDEKEKQGNGKKKLSGVGELLASLRNPVKVGNFENLLKIMENSLKSG